MTVNKADLLIVTRPFNSDDRNFILATFLRGLYYGDTWFSEIDKRVFMETYNKVVNHIIDAPSTSITVACFADDPATILGYAMVGSGTNLHWVFVKKKWRGIGIAKDLVPSSIKNVTHVTKVGLAIIRKKGLAFNPFLI